MKLIKQEVVDRAAENYLIMFPSSSVIVRERTLNVFKAGVEFAETHMTLLKLQNMNLLKQEIKYLSSLRVLISLLEKQKKTRYTNLEKLTTDLKVEFGIDASVEDVTNSQMF